jgi:tRNA modification GTPase
VNIEGVPVLLTDTAGVRSSVDEIETLGVERTHRAIADADFVVVVLDGSEPLTHSDQEIFDQVKNTPHIFALNKNDLTSCTNETLINNLPKNKVISLSAKTQNGIDLLKAAVLEPFINRDTQNTGLLITSARHFDLLQRTQIALRSSIRLMGERASEELILVGLYNALHFLGEITGETTPEDVLSQIFATFCIGK